MPKQTHKEPSTYTELMKHHGFSYPDSGNRHADYRRMEEIALIIGKTRRRNNLPEKPCRACGQTQSGCWESSDGGRESLCVNQPPSIDWGEEGDEHEEGYDSDWTIL